MYIERMTPEGLSAIIVVPWETEKRLRGTCYRGPECKCAGNFMNFTSSDDLLGCQPVLAGILTAVDYFWKERRFGSHRFAIPCPDYVGWESTAPRDNFSEADLEKFDINECATGIRVKTSRTDLRSPKTREITVVLQVLPEGDSALIIIFTVHPGEVIGRLKGNVSGWSNRVFYDWNHPGVE